MLAFAKINLGEQEVIGILNEEIYPWKDLVWFLKSALNYRRELILEFNCQYFMQV